jgi:hypothetical protein
MGNLPNAAGEARALLRPLRRHCLVLDHELEHTGNLSIATEVIDVVER